MLHTQVPHGIAVLKSRAAYHVKLTDTPHQYDLYVQTCANRPSMHEGIDFQNSYMPVGHIDSLRMIMCIAASKQLCCNLLDISDAFQNSIIFDPQEHVYLTLPPWYLEWFQCKWPDFKLASMDIKLLVLQCLKSIQGTKQAGNQWY